MENEFKNFGMLIPKYCTHLINGCFINNATSKEFEDFKKWVDSGEIIQLRANDEFIDLWIEKQGDFTRRSMTLNAWFDYWKNPPQHGYSFTSFETKL
jgi:hypothetical protein